MLNSTLTAIILHDEEEEVIPDERKAIFYAAAELAVRYYFLFFESHKLTDYDLGRAGPARLASCIGKIPSESRYHHPTRGARLRSPDGRNNFRCLGPSHALIKVGEPSRIPSAYHSSSVRQLSGHRGYRSRRVEGDPGGPEDALAQTRMDQVKRRGSSTR